MSDIYPDSCDAGTKDGEEKPVDMSSKEPKLVDEIPGNMPVDLSSQSIGSFEVDDSEQYDKLTQKYSDLSSAKQSDSEDHKNTMTSLKNSQLQRNFLTMQHQFQVM